MTFKVRLQEEGPITDNGGSESESGSEDYEPGERILDNHEACCVLRL
jgi:hypothetical protein